MKEEEEWAEDGDGQDGEEHGESNPKVS